MLIYFYHTDFEEKNILNFCLAALFAIILMKMLY